MNSRGCKGWLNTISNNKYPQFELKRFNGQLIERNDTFQRAFNSFKTFQYVALGRIVNSIPNFWKRYEFASAYVWSNKDRKNYVAKLGMSAQDMLLKRMSTTGLSLLQKIRPYDWDLLAVPLDGEKVDASNLFDGCQFATANTVSVSITLNGNKADAKVNVVEMPEWMLASIDWGDSVMDDQLFKTAEKQFAHEYAKAGTYAVKFIFMNADGLQTIVTKQVTITKAATVAKSQSIAPHTRVLIAVTAQGANRGGGAGNLQTAIAASDAYGLYTPIGFEKLKTITDDKGFWAITHIDYQLKYNWDAVTPISKLRITCRSVNNYLYVIGNLLIRNVTLQVFTSNGQEAKYVHVPIASAVNLNKPADKIFADKEGRFGISCARRGDVYEDDPVLMELTLDKSKMPVMQSTAANAVVNEGNLKEVVPGKFETFEIAPKVALLSRNE